MYYILVIHPLLPPSSSSVPQHIPYVSPKCFIGIAFITSKV